MKKGILLSIVQTIIVIFIQTSALHVFGITHWAPNLFAAILIPGTLLYGPLYGTLVGCFGGLMIDLLTGYGLGMTAIPCCIGGFATGILGDYINGEHYLTSVTFSIVLVAFSEFFALTVFYLSRKVISVNLNQVFHTLLILLTTGGVSALFHTMLHRQHDARLDKGEIQSRYIQY